MRKILRSRPYLWNFLLLAVALVASVAAGPVLIPAGTLFSILLNHLPGLDIPTTWPAAFETIVLQIRLPNAALVALTGAALSGSGAAYQGLFRNPLADPYLIGVASGAGLGAVLALTWSFPSTWPGYFLVPAAAFTGAMLTVGLVYQMARVNRMVPVTTLILAGVAISSFATSLTSFLMLRSNEELRRALAWLLGSSLLGGWEPVLAALPYILVGLGGLALSGHALNVLQFGEEQAQQLGLPVERVRLLLVVFATLATAAAVAFSGLIGFIGLIVPHLVRFIWGHDYKRLVPLSILGGSSFLLLADLLARMIMAPQTLPVGIVTALVGAPFFLWVLRRARAEAYW